MEKTEMDDAELFRQLVERANKENDGHLTIMKFTTNWRVCFGIPGDTLEECRHMPVGSTFAEAAKAALDEPRSLYEIRLSSPTVRR